MKASESATYRISHEKMARFIGMVLFVGGAALLLAAYRNGSDPLERILDTLIGQGSNQATWLFLAGLGSALSGATLYATNHSR